MDRQWLEEWKRQISLLDYLQQHDWKPCLKSGNQQVGGLCPLHAESRPSFWVHTRKNLFYCHGCGRGGDLIRLVELYHGMRFPQALAHLRQWAGAVDLMADAVRFYQAQLPDWPEALNYLAIRGLRDPLTIQTMGIGYAPGGCLRGHLCRLGYNPEDLRQAGLINARGADTFYRRVIFPCGNNLYGRSIDGGPPHRFLVGSKGGLYRWERMRSAPRVILVEGMLDVATLWQAGFGEATCGWGTHLNRQQFEQLTAGHRTVSIAFDSDPAGETAARRLAVELDRAGQRARRVALPPGYDPASYFAAGASAGDFRALLEATPS